MPFSASVGAVALPDGRVLICGGVAIDLVAGGRVWNRAFCCIMNIK